MDKLAYFDSLADHACIDGFQKLLQSTSYFCLITIGNCASDSALQIQESGERICTECQSGFIPSLSQSKCIQVSLPGCKYVSDTETSKCAECQTSYVLT